MHVKCRWNRKEFGVEKTSGTWMPNKNANHNRTTLAEIQLKLWSISSDVGKWLGVGATG
jgi:hypothetical protein